ncbi:MAG: acylphosphatase [Candidatus Methanoperedens sp.]
MKRLTLQISGNVQRAGYRTKVVSIAEALTITGTIQNLKDGRVKIIAEGNEKDLERFIHAVDIKNTLINVVNIEKEYSSYTGDYQGFYKLVGGGETDERLDTAADLLKELIHVTKNGFDKLENKIDGLGEGLGQKIDQNRVEISSEIHSLRDDLKAHFDERLSKMESELFEIKSRVDTIQYLSPSKMSSKAEGQKAR